MAPRDGDDAAAPSAASKLVPVPDPDDSAATVIELAPLLVQNRTPRQVPALTVAAVARRLGVAPATLRTWDRRYGLGPSAHAAGSHRRYTADDVDRDQALPRDRAEVTRMVADLQLFAVHAQDTAMRVLVPQRLQPERPKLTPRELDSLRWTMEGKTAWEVGAILGISERTAVLHINNAMHKLNCTNKHQAVLKALRLGLIR